MFGIAAHLYSLRRQGDLGIGDFETLARAGEAAGRAGAALLGINPLHHLFPADRDRRSPYHPSDRRFLDPIYIDAAAVVDEFGGDTARRELGRAAADVAKLEEPAFVDYAGVWQLKQRVPAGCLRRSVEVVRAAATCRVRSLPFDGGRTACAATANTNCGPRMPARIQAFPPSSNGSPTANSPRRRHAHVQPACHSASTAISRSAWRRTPARSPPTPRSFMTGVSIGAPPDPFSAAGQVWNLPPFNPLALERTGATAFAEIIDANMRHAGVLRVDHILGLSRLFVVPDGAPAAAGAYLNQPADLLFAVLAEASHRHRTSVIGEDLGTVPDGLAARLRQERILSYRVLWFERDGTRFRAPSDYPAEAAACLSTHDLPTLRGWLGGRDIEIEQALGRIDAATAARAPCRGAPPRLRHCAHSPLGKCRDEPSGLAAAVHATLAAGRSVLMLVQADDLAGETEPLNVPGTDREWPNWGRRIEAPVETLLETPAARSILAAVKGGRAKAAG